MTKIECSPIKLTGCDKSLRSVRERNGIHCLDKPENAGEPISQVDFRLYRVVLEEDGGLPRQDAKKQTKILKELYSHGDPAERNRIANVIHSTFEGLIARKKFQPVNLPPIEITVFSKK